MEQVVRQSITNLADKRYGGSSSTQNEQSIYYYNGYPVSGLSSHLNLLEDFSPYRLSDPFHWLPQGLFYDMMDARNEQKLTGDPVDDNVSGYYKTLAIIKRIC